MTLRLTSWNINSLRRRLHHLPPLVEEVDPDILCLQETKVPDSLFPVQALKDLGYPHILFSGQKAYNGVAIASRLPITPDIPRDWCGSEDKRHLCGFVQTPAGRLEIHNFYIPAGGDIPDPQSNPKFAHKLRFLAELTNWFSARTQAANQPLILLGDLNIAPLASDVWSHRQLRNVVSHTEVEIRALERLQASLPWVDAVRHVIPEEEHAYSWWSYRSRDWQASNRGRRLDHLWLSPVLLPHLKDAEILVSARGWDSPSDHVPVTMTLEL